MDQEIAEQLPQSYDEEDMDVESDREQKQVPPSQSMLNGLPDWCTDKKYRRYWHQYDQVKNWFNQHSTRSEASPASQQQSYRCDPLFQQYSLQQAWNSSYWVHYHYHNMAKWHHRWLELSQKQYQADYHPYPSNPYDDHGPMPPPRTTFVPRPRPNSQCSTSSECGGTERKRSKQQVSSKKYHKDHVTDIVLDLDPSVLKEEEEIIECHMEITDEMLEFFAQSARHRQERDAQKVEADAEEKVKYIDISQANSGAARATSEAPKERPGLKRTQEMKVLYGRGAAMIHGMETAMQLTFDRYVDLKQPKLWPHLPLSIKFD